MTDFKATGKNEFVDQYPYITYSEDAESVNDGGGSETLPVASAETLGGVKVGEGLSITENGVLSASGGGGDEPFIITFSTLGSNHVDKTFDEIYQALENNPLNVYMKYDPSGTGMANYLIRPAIYGRGSTDLINFTVIYYMSGNNLAVATVSVTPDGCTFKEGAIQLSSL